VFGVCLVAVVLTIAFAYSYGRTWRRIACCRAFIPMIIVLATR
jgi:hypothetical protein